MWFVRVQGRALFSDITDLVFQAGLIVQLVLVLLLASSIASWAIILSKWRELRNARQDSEAFLEVYHRDTLEASVEAARHLDGSPLSIVFLSTCNEMSRVTQGQDEVDLKALDAQQRRSLRKVISWTTDRERWRLERGLPFLGTVGSSAPFVGLFGTVIGIITTFQSIGRAGSASLAVVGPGMAEALVATGVGLLAAIPATIAYNYFATRLDSLDSSLNLYAEELIEDLRLDRQADASLELMEGL
jgi:biopolymer transport protein TolQ